jgi:hypothetical protein
MPLTLAWLGVVSMLMAVEAAPAAPDREEAVRLALDVLAARLGMRPEGISIQETTATEWPDSSLGCPQKGLVYTARVIPGFVVRLRVDDQILDLRVGEGRAVVCERPVDPGRAGVTAAASNLYKLARRDLAARLKIAEKQVKVQFVRPTKWPDARLGCPGPEPGAEAAREVQGFTIELRADAKTYTYHADTARVVLCPP